MSKKTIITGIFGQDGSYLCELLFRKGYDVYGIVRKELSCDSLCIQGYLRKNGIIPKTIAVELDDFNSLKNLLIEINPDEIYHLAASHISSQGFKDSDNEKVLFESNVLATSNILFICNKYLKHTKIVLAGSCLMFDGSNTTIQNEETPFESNSLYGLAKITEHSLVKYYRNRNLHVSMAILYNHESPRRKADFVTRKIVSSMVAIREGKLDTFILGDINIKKDWGFAGDYVHGMYLMLQQDCPDDYILSSGELHSISEIVEICASNLKINNWESHIHIDSSILDRKIKNRLFGECVKAQKKLGWRKAVGFYELISLLIEAELNKEFY